MAAATSGTPTSSRIPLDVIHGNQDCNSRYSTYKSTASNGTAGGHSASAFDMAPMSDETDRIKQRMKEFEDRCNRWREDFFTKERQQTFMPDPPPNFSDLNNNKYCSSAMSNHMPCAASGASSIPFTSTLHKSYVEDTADGGKKYKIEFDIGDFNQNELQISTNGKALTVKGDREVKSGATTETKTFNRELTVPDYVDLEKMNAFLSSKDAKNLLVLEAPILMEKYQYRRSAFDKSNTASAHASPARTNKSEFLNSSAMHPPPCMSHSHFDHQHMPRSVIPGVNSESRHHSENKTSTHHSTTTTSHSHTSSRTNCVNDEHFSSNSNSPKQTAPVGVSFSNDEYYQRNKSPAKSMMSNSRSHIHQVTPELIPGYPVYDNKEGCVVYKFDFNGFDQSEIHLTITVDRTLEIKACKEAQDHLGKVYREFKREIQLEPEVDANLIKNLLFEGILTLKIPKPNRQDGNGSMSNNHNLHSPNGFQEFYTDQGKLAKLTSDFKGFSPENVKIVLSANNVLKLSAVQSETSVNNGNSKGTVKKECNRQYTLPAWIQPEQMRAIMSRDGILTVDFTGKSAAANQPAYDDRIHIN